MPITWENTKLSWNTAAYSWTDFSVAYELFLLGGRGGAYKRQQMYTGLFKDPEKKRKVIQLIMKVKSNEIKKKVQIPADTQIALSDIDMVIQEVLNKPQVNIYVS